MKRPEHDHLDIFEGDPYSLEGKKNEKLLE